MGLALTGVFLLWSFLTQVAHATSLENDLPPLPRECEGISPSGYPAPTCCMVGYVHYVSATLTEPLLAEGAVVTLTTQGGTVTSTRTAPGWLNTEGMAYFEFDLSKAGAQPGEVVTLTASYLEKQDQVIYQVVTGGQQVDIVLPEARGFDPVTVVVDDQDEAPSPDAPGFYIAGPAEQILEATCGSGSEFWSGTTYSGTSTVGGLGPPTISATYRPTLPVSGTYELFAYGPHGCAGGFMHYAVHITGSQVVTTLVDQGTAGESQGRWISLGLFDLPAGTDSYVVVNNLTRQPSTTVIGFDALKWELRTPFPAIATVTVDDLDQADTSDEVGFYKNDVLWGERTTECGDGSLVSGPIYWSGHIYWTKSIVVGPPVNWAQWRASLPTKGVYDIYAFVPVCYATARAARYRIYESGELVDEVTLDQAPQGGVWVYLGSYDLPGGNSNTVYLDDVTGEDQKLLAFDAVRWVLRPRFRPVATIHSISPASAVQGQDVVTLRGGGSDTDGAGASIVAYEWRSNLDGLLATSGTFTVAADVLSAGTHVLTFRAQDDEGLWSHPITTHLEIQPPGLEESWHFMLYFAGDNNLSPFLSEALNRLEEASIPEGVTVTVLFDRAGGGGVWRYEVQPDGNYTTGINRWYLGEKNTGVSETLADYILWAQETYPADYYYLAVSDHGRGIQGIAWDDDSDGDYLTLPELRIALQQGTDNGLLKVDVLHLDACLMAMLEVGYEIRPYADYLVASENLAWALFGYKQYMEALAPTTTPRDLAVRVADIYHDQIGVSPHTMSVLDLRQVSALAGEVDILAGALLNALPGERVTLTRVLSQVQRFDSRDYGRIDAQDEFVDLRHLVELLAVMSDDQAVRGAARRVLTATALSEAGVVTTTVVHEQHISGYHGAWWDLDNANGVALYFPPSVLSWDYGDYVTTQTLQLGNDTRWDELLQAYLGLPLLPPPEPAPPLPLELRRVYLPLILRNTLSSH
jgi:hypothetical protein